MKKSGLFFLSIILIAINMRLPITAIPPLIPSLEKILGISSNATGLLTTIPLLTFAGCSPFVAKIAQHFGNERTIGFFLLFLITGSLLRVVQSTATMLVGTFLIGIGIASANVLLPAVIKNKLNQPLIGITVYSTSMLMVGAMGTGVAGFLVAKISLFTIEVGLLIIACFSLIGWLPAFFQHSKNRAAQEIKRSATHNIWKSKLGWLVTLFFGLQALVYYSLLTWVPTIFVSFGFTQVEGSSFATWLQIGSLPFSFLVPLIARKMSGLKGLLGLMSAAYFTGLVLTLTTIHNVILMEIVMLVIGAASGIAFNLAVVFFTLKANDGGETAELSGMAQSAGYLLAAVGPMMFGTMHALTASWKLTLVLCLVLVSGLGLIGILIARTPNQNEKTNLS